MRLLTDELFDQLLGKLQIIGEVNEQEAFFQSILYGNVIEFEFKENDDPEIEVYRIDASFEIFLNEDQKEKIINAAISEFKINKDSIIEREKSYECTSVTQSYN